MSEYKDTLHLPQTEFSMRAGLAQKEPALLARWEQEDLYGKIQKQSAGRPRFVLHDGPPYANGHLHHGHILNKILKDIVVRDRTMAGFSAPYVPGWDCHGLPIEVQVDKELGARKSEMSKAEVRESCRAYADKFIAIQRDEFKRLGVLGRWQKPYRTMDFAYEATSVRQLAKIAEHGLLYKGLRPVNWCTVHQTALAEAEVEYQDHVSPSIYVALTVHEKYPVGWDAAQPLDFVIWTTTPWTLPANAAVAVHADHDYIAYPVRGRARIVARGLIDSFLKAVGEEAFDERNVLARWKGAALEGCTYRHPLFDRISPCVLGDHVTLEAGTGCVHTAPGHGPDDFEVGRHYGLPVLSPVDDKGVFRDEAGPYKGLHVWAANAQIIADLHAKQALLSDPAATVSHRYAHCWRCHKPIILRATAQWWMAMDKPYAGGGTLRERALASLKEVTWIPSWGYDRIHGMLAGRPDWCLSRQRTWGVPIPVVYCNACDEPLIDPTVMRRVADVFEKEGASAWFVRPAEELIGAQRCPHCDHASFRKENDILDVWFESGASYAAVIEAEGMGHGEGPLVDLYLEGSDQHRGWFHSSLLCSLATRLVPPYRQVLTHGFVVDGQGKKISKSKGNFVDPFVAIQQDGAELLRLWVAGEEYREDIRISKEILTRLSEMYRKIRNTLRYALGSLDDFDPARDMVQPSDLTDLDAYALCVTEKAVQRMRTGYETYAFHHVVQAINELCTVDLSAFYFDVLKDRLYASRRNSIARRSAQTALYLITRDIVRLMAPVLCFTAEEAWSYLKRLEHDPDSVHLTAYPSIDVAPEPNHIQALRCVVAARAEALMERYGFIRELRRQVNGVLEERRREKVIGSSTEARVRLLVPGSMQSDIARFSATDLADLLIVSHVEISHTHDAVLGVEVEKATGIKCPRCWLYRDEVGSQQPICHRCTDALA